VEKITARITEATTAAMAAQRTDVTGSGRSLARQDSSFVL
jgi:hypothetical protein